MRTFKENWDFIVNRSQEAAIPVVQNEEELEHVFQLLRNCASYLEVGAAEGNSLYVLTKAMPAGSEVTYIDYGENHTTPHRNFILDNLTSYNITAVHGDSNDYSTAKNVAGQMFDAVLIDAGHDDFNVAIDALFYGPMARKYLIFHDIQLPDVNRVFEWYSKNNPNCKSYRVVNSTHYGFGIIVV